MVKICGIKNSNEASWVVDAGADLCGIVVFYPKSKRNLTIGEAEKIIECYKDKIKFVAVTVSPDADAVSQIEDAGFDYIQIHGRLEDDLLEQINIPVIRAFNVSDMQEFDKYKDNERIAGFVFDANLPGSGLSFDYKLLAGLDFNSVTDKFMLLAGGLSPENVKNALLQTGFKGADASSGVENDDGIGKNKEKVYSFVRAAKELN